jgi:hypothetical protein
MLSSTAVALRVAPLVPRWSPPAQLANSWPAVSWQVNAYFFGRADRI